MIPLGKYSEVIIFLIFNSGDAKGTEITSFAFKE